MKKSTYWKNKKVLITGGTGFLGSHLVKKFTGKGVKKLTTIGSKDFDLRKYSDCLKAVTGYDVVIHLAANVGGIGYNQKYPATLFDDNILMGVNIVIASREKRIKKLVFLGTICSYPKYTKVPFKEKDLWNGYPEETNAPYGIAKKAVLVQLQAYRSQYGFNGIYLMPVNLYGPGDNFNPKSSHVIPAMIKKFVDARDGKSENVVLWGTGKATREFLYVGDAADAIVLAAEKYDDPEPVNLGSGQEISIKALSEIIQRETSYKGKIVWDKSKPDGQPRRKLDTKKAEKQFGFVAKTTFDIGIKNTIQWYEENKSKLS